MDKTHGELMRKRFTGFLYLAIIAFFNTVPLFIISVLANLNSVSISHSYTFPINPRSSFKTQCLSLIHGPTTPQRHLPLYPVCSLLPFRVSLDSSFRGSFDGFRNTKALSLSRSSIVTWLGGTIRSW